MGSGEYAAGQLEKKRKKWKKKSKKYSKQAERRGNKFKGVLKGAPMGSGIVIGKKAIEARQPNSALRKCVVVQLKKNGIKVAAFAPRDKAITYIDEHDEVVISGINGKKGGPYGDLWGVRYKVEKVNNISLEMLRTKRKEKVRR